MSVTRERGAGEGRKKKFLFRIGGRKSPKNGSVRDLTLWFRIKDGEKIAYTAGGEEPYITLFLPLCFRLKRRHGISKS